jgi:phage shock protein PspC (stress-responsive transcriptional regulator)
MVKASYPIQMFLKKRGLGVEWDDQAVLSLLPIAATLLGFRLIMYGYFLCWFVLPCPSAYDSDDRASEMELLTGGDDWYRHQTYI